MVYLVQHLILMHHHLGSIMMHVLLFPLQWLCIEQVPMKLGVFRSWQCQYSI